MASLFNLTAELQQLYNLFTSEADEHGEVPPDAAAMITSQLEATEAALAVKLDSYIDLIRRLEGEATIAEDEEERYSNLAATRRNAAAQLKQSLKLHMETIGASKVHTATQAKCGFRPMAVSLR